jgi:hypothetical protein
MLRIHINMMRLRLREGKTYATQAPAPALTHFLWLIYSIPIEQFKELHIILQLWLRL